MKWLIGVSHLILAGVYSYLSLSAYVVNFEIVPWALLFLLCLYTQITLQHLMFMAGKPEMLDRMGRFAVYYGFIFAMLFYFYCSKVQVGSPLIIAFFAYMFLALLAGRKPNKKQMADLDSRVQKKVEKLIERNKNHPRHKKTVRQQMKEEVERQAHSRKKRLHR